ncbi:hypothetical protein BSKO_10517 [Bryopsis sp. KO-2023]|nr:hypothetical protein BSKO_10517 [Bryopsis sp. KO-2023]
MPRAKKEAEVPKEMDRMETPLKSAAKTPQPCRKRKAAQGGTAGKASTVESVRGMIARMVEERVGVSEAAFESVERAAAKEIREVTALLTAVNDSIVALGKGANTKLAQLARDGESMASGLESAKGEFLQYINTEGTCVQPFKKFRRDVQQGLGELESKQ